MGQKDFYGVYKVTEVEGGATEAKDDVIKIAGDGTTLTITCANTAHPFQEVQYHPASGNEPERIVAKRPQGAGKPRVYTIKKVVRLMCDENDETDERPAPGSWTAEDQPTTQ